MRDLGEDGEDEGAGEAGGARGKGEAGGKRRIVLEPTEEGFAAKISIKKGQRYGENLLLRPESPVLMLRN